MLKFFRSLLLLPLFVVGAALAADTAFDTSKFDALNTQGKPILVGIHADWCPTCRAQQPIIAELLNTPEFQGITSLRVDFDKQKEVVRRFKAQYQSTLIVFKGGKEVGRLIGETQKENIAALLKKSI